MNIDHPYPGTMFWNFTVICQNITPYVFRHTHSIILYADVNIFTFLLSTYKDLTIIILIHITYSIIYCIFQKRLNHQFYNTVIFNLFIYQKLYLKSFFIAYTLNIHITSAVLQFVSNRDNRLSPG